MDRLVHLGAAVVDPGGEQDRAGGKFEAFTRQPPVIICRSDFGNVADAQVGTVLRALLAHPPQQIGAGDSVGKSGVIVAGGDQRRPAAAAVEQHLLAAEPRKIDRCGQPGRAATDDGAIEDLIGHSLSLKPSWLRVQPSRS